MGSWGEDRICSVCPRQFSQDSLGPHSQANEKLPSNSHIKCFHRSLKCLKFSIYLVRLFTSLKRPLLLLKITPSWCIATEMQHCLTRPLFCEHWTLFLCLPWRSQSPFCRAEVGTCLAPSSPAQPNPSDNFAEGQTGCKGCTCVKGWGGESRGKYSATLFLWNRKHLCLLDSKTSLASYSTTN